MNFKTGSTVRQRGKSQEMTVVGKAGLTASSVTPGKTTSMVGRVLCKWIGKNGKGIQRSFDEGDLELVRD